MRNVLSHIREYLGVFFIWIVLHPLQCTSSRLEIDPLLCADWFFQVCMHNRSTRIYLIRIERLLLDIKCGAWLFFCFCFDIAGGREVRKAFNSVCLGEKKSNMVCCISLFMAMRMCDKNYFKTVLQRKKNKERLRKMVSISLSTEKRKHQS